MKHPLLLISIAFALALLPSARAELCPKHKGSAFIASVGECKECGGFTASGAFKLCKKCSTKLDQCEACRAELKADEKPSDPAKKLEKKEGEKSDALVHRAPNGKAFPAHWGAPPLAQTRDLRPLPGDYGSGSGTLVRWIQENLDKDAKQPAPKPAPVVHKGPNGKAFPAHWGEPPRIQTRDLGPLPGGYGQGSGTLGRWIQQNLDKDAAGNPAPPVPKPVGAVPTFEEWMKDGKKIPAGRVFIGGSPWFNERTGENRTPEAVYKMLYGQTQPKPANPIAPPAGGRKPFPAHWGAPPAIQTKDLRPLPGGYGMGSSTLARWIQENLDKDLDKGVEPPPLLQPRPGRDPEAPKVNLNDIAKVKVALETWAKSKTACAGNYEYTVAFSSAFGFGHTTVIVVRDNKVVERRYEEFDRNRPPLPGAPPNGYTEKGEAVGKDKKGAPAKTLDELYQVVPAIAAKALLPHQRRYLLTDANGLLTSCFIKDTRIADDGPKEGLSLGAIKLNVVKKTEGAPPTGAPVTLQASSVAISADAPEPAPAAVAVKVHSGHFVSNQYKPDDALTLALFHTLADFKIAFGTAAFGLGRGGKQLDYVNEAAFNNGVVAALIHRGNTPYEYKLIAPTDLVRGVLTLNIRAAGQPSDTATFASPLIVSMPRAGITHVRFVENDRELGQVALAPAAAAVTTVKASLSAATQPGALKETITLRDLQGGFAGFTGWLTTINPDGTWNRRQVFNQQLREISHQGSFSVDQVKSLNAVLAAARVEQLPERIGQFAGANPHVVTLTVGNRQSVLTLPAGGSLPQAHPGDKLDAVMAFAMVANELNR